jgi:hypothetical protein
LIKNKIKFNNLKNKKEILDLKFMMKLISNSKKVRK